ncbi:unnamed protein product [Malus baccata var. baccata]
MPREDAQLTAAKKSYRNAKAVGNHEEEARWANAIGDMLKKRGEYVAALQWLRIDYDVSVKYLPQKHCLPTCQSLGELYLRLECFKEALIYQKKHLQLAEDENNLVEQQRANTQLGRTYHEMFLRSIDEHCSIRNAKKYFKSAMKLAQMIKENPPTNNSFVEEYIDAHNNIGMLEFDLDNWEEARKVLTKGLEICDEEEVMEDDAGRSRLHHNLGNVYIKLRMWDNAREHIEKDIMICKRIEHCQGEAKGYINLGELHYLIQKYEEAIHCYQKALELAKSMEDEDALLRQIDQNIETVEEARKVMDGLKKEEQNLKKLMRDMASARGTPRERKCLLQQFASLDCLIEKSRMILAWPKLLEFAKKKKVLAIELYDQEKISDSLLVIGESYQNLREFKKALKWCTKSLEKYRSIGNLEGQALAKVNIGDVLDSVDNLEGALDAFEEGYRLAVEANLPSVQLMALENMHYSHMIRFDNVEEARRLQFRIKELKKSEHKDLETENVAEDRCSESDTEGSGHLSDGVYNACCSSEIRKSSSSRSQSLASMEELNDDEPLISLKCSTKDSLKVKSTPSGKQNNTIQTNVSSKNLSKPDTNEQTVIGRKRVRLVLSDDEDEMQDEVPCSKSWSKKQPLEFVATSDELKSKSNTASPTRIFQDVSAYTTNGAMRFCDPVDIEQSSSSCKSRNLNLITQKGKGFKALRSDGSPIVANGSKGDTSVSKNVVYDNDAAHLMFLTSDDEHNQCITFKIDRDLIHLDYDSFSDKLSIESIKTELACLYYLRLPIERRSEGLLPKIKNIKWGERVIESLEAFEMLKQHMGKALVEAFIDGWVQKRLIKLYTDCCYKSSATPNMKLLKKLYEQEVSDDDVSVSDCGLQDFSLAPLLDALHIDKTFGMLDLSHNALGIDTMKKLQQVITSSCQKYAGLMLDLHFNRFSITSLVQICECPSLFARLEVLNISENPLTDRCASCLSIILENCKALCSLSIERCSVTCTTIEKVADALNADSVLEQLCIGYNSIRENTIINLLSKLGTLKRFSKLSLNGLKLKQSVVDSLCKLAKTLSLSGLSLRETGIGIDGALLLTESLFSQASEFVKLDFSKCEVTSNYVHKLSTDSSMICGIVELNLSGNPIMEEGSNALSSMLLDSQCSLKVLSLQKCKLGTAGILRIIQALSDNGCLEELNLADNANVEKQYSESTPTSSAPKEANPAQPGSCHANTDLDMLEVADSEDDQEKAETAAHEFDDSCTSPWQSTSSSPRSQFIQELSTAVSMAKNLQLLDLSSDGFSRENAETLYSSWSSSRVGSARRHIKDQTIHLFVKGIKCCVKPCCRKD